MIENNNILIEDIKQTNKTVKNFLNVSLLLGSIGFLTVGISSYINKNIIELLDASKIIFYPQGLTMSIYGSLGFFLSINQIIITQSGIGEGYNEFNKNTKTLKIVRKKSIFENIELSYSIQDIESIILDNKTDFFNVKQKLFIILKDKRKIPILESEESKHMEEKATKIAYFLKIPLKGI